MTALDSSPGASGPSAEPGAAPPRTTVPQRQQRHQMPRMQARRGGVEAGVHRHRSALHFGGQGVEVGGLRDQPTPAQLVEDHGVKG